MVILRPDPLQVLMFRVDNPKSRATDTTTKTSMKRLFWDLETSPNVVLAFRAGYDVVINHDAIVKERKIICVGYKWEDEKDAHVIRWDRNQDDKILLKKFLAIANGADEMVAHFGDRFDIPWFRTRCLIHDLDPLPPYKTIDTKQWASKNFYFNSAKLDYLADVLGYGRKTKMEFGDWKKIVMEKDQAALDKMCSYCARDVKLLEKVYKRFAPNVKVKSHVGVLAGQDKASCSHCGNPAVVRSKIRVTSNGTVQHQMRCNSCRSYSTISDSAYKAFINGV